MPRTVETIVENHRAAAALRAAGKSIWPYKADIKGIILEEQGNEDPACITAKAHRIAKALRVSLPKKFFDQAHEECDFNFLDVVEMMEDCSVEALAEDLKNGSTAVEMMDGWLEQIYDWADRNRVWLGL